MIVGGHPRRNRTQKEFVLTAMRRVVLPVSEDIITVVTNVQIRKHLSWMENVSVLRE